MKHQKRLFNELLRRYNKYRNRLQNLQQANRNHRRQNILQKHIERLYVRLSALWVNLQKPVAIVSVAMTAMAFQPQEANAQTFASSQFNPFSLNYQSDYYTLPSFVDLDADGDLDVMSGSYDGEFFYYFENIGTSTSPTFAVPLLNPFSLSSVSYRSKPTFADLDADGDFDMMAGDYYGNFYYFENTGTASSPQFSTQQTNPFSLTKLTNYSTPVFADLDGDGDFDLFAGDLYGNFYYYENTGTVNAPSFTTVQQNPFSLTKIPDYYSVPDFGDLDNDGDLDLISGGDDGDFYYYENIGTSTSPTFTTLQTNPFSLGGVGYFSAPAIADLDDDCDLDLLSGEYYAGFYYFENISPAPEVEILGNGTEIVDGDTLPATTDSTDFGAVCGSQTTEYTIKNLGTDTLTIDPNIIITGVNAADFAITIQPLAAIAAGDSTLFTVVFTPSATGLREATITVKNGDCSESVYTFGVQGTGDGPDVSVTNTSPTLTANQTGATYQWLDCDNNFAVISGATNQSYTATANGNYAVEITENNCTDTSACFAVTNSGFIESTLAKNLKVYPNPTNGQVTIDFGGVSTSATITITNGLGQVVNREVITVTNKAMLTINGSQGFYFVEITTESGYKQRMKVVKQ